LEVKLLFSIGYNIEQKQVKNNVWQGTTADKNASQLFSASYAAQPRAAPPAECRDRKSTTEVKSSYKRTRMDISKPMSTLKLLSVL
jgi:hypothetical protein